MMKFVSGLKSGRSPEDTKNLEGNNPKMPPHDVFYDRHFDRDHSFRGKKGRGYRGKLTGKRKHYMYTFSQYIY